VVVVTGGAQGIGKCLVESFAREGALVHFCDSNPAAGESLQASLSQTGNPTQFHCCDLGTITDVDRVATQILSDSPRLDVLVNNVGITAPASPLATRPIDEWDRMLAVGLTSYYRLSQLFATALSQTKGSIVNISSTRALMSEPNTEPYSAVKGAIVALTHSLAITLGELGVRVYCISPGWIDVTDGQFPPARQLLSPHALVQHPVGRVGSPEDIAQACLFLASSFTAGFITGQNLVVDGGMVRKMIYVE
jgi:NAD(P)-dependent dehydrogenase (short-subunit alcohol dehydrogenase family)